jgi:type VI secretion system protein ImpI
MTVSIQIIRIPEGEVVTYREYYASEMPFVIGREYDCDLVLNDSGLRISRYHAELRRDDAGEMVFVDRSTNGTVVNGKELWKGGKVSLSDGDRVKIGEYELLFCLSDTGSAVLQPSPGRNGVIPERPFSLNAGTNDHKLIDLEEELEAPSTPEFDTFTEGGMDLVSELLFDPFADGPELQEKAAHPKVAPAANVKIVDGDIMPLDNTALDMQSSAPSGPAAGQTGWLVSQDREANESAIEAAVDRLLELVDPDAVEGEYREFLGPFSRTSRRYWKIHKRMFARKRASGEYMRLFKAILAEEIKKR